MGKTILAWLGAFLLTAGIAFAADISGDTAGRIKASGQKLEQMAVGKTGEYAGELLDAVRANLAAAQAAFTGGNDRLAAQRLEMADMQMSVAEAKTSEKDVAEETALRRAELKKLEARLERYLQGGE